MARRTSDWVGALYDAHAASMFAYALALLGNAEEAEDAVQEVFVRICASGRVPDNPRHYLLRSVRNEAYSRLRKRRGLAALLRFWKRTQPEHVFVSAVKDGLAPEAINEAFNRLPAEQREVVMLKFYEGLKFEEIADVAGVSANTAASRYRYGIEKLRDLLHQEHPHE